MEKEKKPKLIPQWIPTVAQRKHLADKAAEDGTTITGYIKNLVNADMKRKRE
jgi:hypothetical protein